MRTVVNVLANWAAFVLGTAITFFLSPFVVHHLGDARYGVWAVTGSIVGYLGLLDLGVRVGVTRFVARYAATRDQQAMNRVVSTALGLFLAFGALASVLGVVIAVLLPSIVQVSPTWAREAQLALAISGATVAVGLVGGVYGGVLAGIQRFTQLNAIDLLLELARAGAVVLALSNGRGLISLSLIQLVIVTIRGALYAIAARRYQPGLEAVQRLFDLQTVREIGRFSGYTVVLHLMAVVIFQTDAIVIAWLMPLAKVTLFVIAGNLCQASLSVLGGVSRALFPAVSSRQARDGVAGTRGLVLSAVRMATLVFLPIVVTFLARGRTFIGLWMGPSFATESGQILEILALGLCVFSSYQVLTTSVMALDLHREMIPLYVGEAIVNFALSIVLGKTLGVFGVAWGTTIPRIVVSVVFGPWYAHRKLGLDYRDYALQAWVRPFLSILPFGITSVLVDHVWGATSIPAFFLQVALLLPVAALGMWTVGIESQERALVRSAIASALGRVQTAWARSRATETP